MKFQADLFRLATLKQRPGLYFVVVALVLSSQIHWVMLQQDFNDIWLRIALAVLLAIPITYLGVFIISLLRPATISSTFLQTVPLTAGVLWLGALFFIGGSIFGMLVPLYLGMCYFAFAPLFRDKAKLIRLDSLFIATTVGVLVSGYLYIVPYRFGIPGEYLAVTVLLALAVFNCCRYKHAILPTVGNATFPVYFTFAVLFFLYGSFTLIAAMKMGAGDFPPVFFGQDTIERLLQAHELMHIVEFPPERLVTKGMTIPIYHMGTSASIAALSTMTGVAVHKAMFWIVSPLLVLGSFSALLLLVRSVLTVPSHRFLALLVFLPEHQWGQTLNGVLFKQDLTFGWGNWFVKNLFGRFENIQYDPNYFDPDIARVDVTHFAGIFCLLLAALLLIKRDYIAVFVLAPILVILTAFVKMNVAFVVVGLVGLRLLAAWRDFGFKRFVVITVALSAVSLGCILLSGYGSHIDGVRGFRVGFEFLSGHIVNSLSGYFSGTPISHYFTHTELVWILLLSALFLLVSFREIRRDTNGPMLVAGGLITVAVCLVVVSFIFLPKVWGHFFTPVWIAIPLCCLALLTKLNGPVWRKTVVAVAVLPIISIAVVHQWRAMEDTMMVMFSPEGVAKYNDNRALGEVMRVIPVENSVVVTEELQYRPSGGTLTSANAQGRNALFSSLFGHQMFGTWGRVWWITEKEREFMQRGLRLQLYHLGLHFNKGQIDFSNQTKRVAKENGWTHFLLKLEPGIERARKAGDVPLEMLFANGGWAVYKF